jgi:hypothetical protein
MYGVLLLRRLANMRAYKKYRQWLCCIFIWQSTTSMASSTHNRADTLPPPQVFTVANVIVNPATPNEVTVAFFESARYYKLLRNNKNYSTALRLLQQAKKKHHAIQVYLTEAFGDTIHKVTPYKKGKS